MQQYPILKSFEMKCTTRQERKNTISFDKIRSFSYQYSKTPCKEISACKVQTKLNNTKFQKNIQ